MKIKLYAVLPSAALALILSSGSAHATTTTIGFDNGTRGDVTGSTVESGYVYSVAVGSVYQNDFGHPDFDMEGDDRFGGGVLEIKTAGVTSPFSFVQLDANAYAYRPDLQPTETLIVYGYLNGNFVGADVYTMSSVFRANWTTKTASTLAGQPVDELQISLPGFSNTIQAWDMQIDTIVLHQDDVVVTPPTSPIPEPSTLALLGTGVLSIAGAARRKLTHA